jgi:hypothetical protein
VRQSEGTLYFYIEASIFGKPSKFYYCFETGQSKWIIATKRKEKKLNLGDTPVYFNKYLKDI